MSEDVAGSAEVVADVVSAVPAYHIANIRGALPSVREELNKIDNRVESLGQENFKVSSGSIQNLISYPADIAGSVDMVRASLREIEEHAGELIKIKIDEIVID